MKRSSKIPAPIEWGVIAFGVWHSRDIIHAWQDSPRDRGGAIVFALWLLPLLIDCVRERFKFGSASPFRTRLSIVAIVTILAGTIGELNALVYCGFALAVTTGTFERSIGLGLTWYLASIAWMPAFSYLTHSLPPTLVLASKFGIVIAALVTISINRRTPSLSEHQI